MALRAKLYLDGDIFFLILLRKIKKKMSPSKDNLARSAINRLFTQPLLNFNLALSAKKIFKPVASGSIPINHKPSPRLAYPLPLHHPGAW